jgi:hypothetical protein
MFKMVAASLVIEGVFVDVSIDTSTFFLVLN